MPRGYNRVERAGAALSDFGESLGRLAYMQAYMQNIKEDNARQQAQQELDKEKLRVQAFLANQEIGQTMYRGAQARGYASPEESNVIAQKMGLEPDLSQGPTLQSVPGLSPRAEALGWEEEKAYGTTYNETLGRNLLPKGTSPDVARSTLISDEEKKASKSAMAYASAEVWKQGKLKASEQKFRADAADDMELKPADRARWMAKGELPDYISDQDVLNTALKFKTYAGTMTSIMGIDIDAQSQMLTSEVNQGLKMDSPEYQKKKSAIDNMFITKTTIENGVMEAIPGWEGLKSMLVDRGLYQKVVGSNEGALDIDSEIAAKKRRIDLLKSKLGTPTQGALGGGLQ